ncbi:MAG: serine/threonine-protein kinase [Bryobacterales bacterium]|nr:serine/threonine-protein kinase [Bryobacterales bacterium]
MDSAQWPMVKDLFLTVRELSSAERDRLLAGSPAGVREEVLSLLDHGSDDTLDTPAIEHAMSFLRDADVPESIGPYRLLQRLGSGGMASVFLAERADGHFEKLVAIKILHAGVFGDDVIRRFLQERQLLASLDHPNIVRLMDGGVLQDSRPYLIEDFIDGEPITKYAANRQLDAAASVWLVAAVAEAVAYAHSRGVIHRDLKPANILVPADGIPKLLDFGVAKLSDSSCAPSAHTQATYWTPGYASPEQARGLPVQAATDIYSLGLILYELLTRRPALQTTGMPPFDAARAVIEFSPDLSLLPQPVRAIAGLCLDKIPSRRPSAADLADRLRNLDWKVRVAWPDRRTLLLAGAVLPVAAGVSYLRRDAPPRLLRVPGPSDECAHPYPSPDGNEIVYRTSHRGYSRILIWDRRANSTRELIVSRTAGVAQPSNPVWSPDGRSIAFLSSQDRGWAAFTVPVSGGTPRQIATRIDVYVAWNHDASGLIYSRRPPGSAPSVCGFSLASNMETNPLPAASRVLGRPVDGGFPGWPLFGHRPLPDTRPRRPVPLVREWPVYPAAYAIPHAHSRTHLPATGERSGVRRRGQGFLSPVEAVSRSGGGAHSNRHPT